MYGGCQSNKNIFLSRSSCEDECKHITHSTFYIGTRNKKQSLIKGKNKVENTKENFETSISIYSAINSIHHINNCFTTITVDRQDKNSLLS